MQKTVVDFFCGGGGIGLGFLEAGYKINASYDFDKRAIAHYNSNISDKVQLMDIRELKGTEIPKSDVWTFGFPCQDLSKNGSNDGLIHGKKSRMFFEIMRLLDESNDNPDFLLAENVPGLDKYVVLLEKEFALRGYKMIYTKQHTFDYGIPQNRDRRYVVGYKNNLTVNENIFREQVQIPLKPLSDYMFKFVPSKYYVTPESFNDGFITKMDGFYRVKQATKIGYIDAYPGDSINVSIPKSKTRRGRVGKKYAQTFLTKKEQLYVTDELNLRWITPREVARLQGFPDSYNLLGSDDDQYFILGNAVTSLIAHRFANIIKGEL